MGLIWLVNEIMVPVLRYNYIIVPVLGIDPLLKYKLFIWADTFNIIYFNNIIKEGKLSLLGSLSLLFRTKMKLSLSSL